MDGHRQPLALLVTQDVSVDDKQYVCRNLYDYNVTQTASLLQKPGININLALKDENARVFGGIFCDTFLYCLYIDVLWVDESCRGLGYGRALVSEAERIARENGCTFAHTSTFSYQTPDFYERAGYAVYAVLDDYPDGIRQYYLKKRL